MPGHGFLRDYCDEFVAVELLVLVMQQIQPHLEQLILVVVVVDLVHFLLQEVVVQVDLEL